MSPRIPITVWIEVPEGFAVSADGNGDAKPSGKPPSHAPANEDEAYVRQKLNELKVMAPDALLDEFATRRILSCITYTLAQGAKVRDPAAYIVHLLRDGHDVSKRV